MSRADRCGDACALHSALGCLQRIPAERGNGWSRYPWNPRAFYDVLIPVKRYWRRERRIRPLGRPLFLHRALHSQPGELYIPKSNQRPLDRSALRLAGAVFNRRPPVRQPAAASGSQSGRTRTPTARFPPSTDGSTRTTSHARPRMQQEARVLRRVPERRADKNIRRCEHRIRGNGECGHGRTRLY